MKAISLLFLALAMPAANAQWQLLDSHTTADLSGIDAVDNSVAWASGSNGAILRTIDGGRTWQPCSVPSGGASLDFHSIQAINDKTAVVMSSGKGDLSRVYKTTDGCQTWKKVFDNPNENGSFASLRRSSAFEMYLLGDPVDGKISMFTTADGGDTWSHSDDPGLAAPKGVEVGGGAALTNVISVMAFGTSGNDASVYIYSPSCKGNRCSVAWQSKPTPLAESGTKAGVLSVAGRNLMVQSRAVVTGIGTEPATTLVAVGGDSEKPAQGNGSAAFSTDDGASWKAADAPPGGYRTAVEFDGDGERFIAVGPNGTDETVDDGLVWQALKPNAGDAPDADKHWTALSLPFVVGPKGRIGKLTAVEASSVFKER